MCPGTEAAEGWGLVPAPLPLCPGTGTGVPPLPPTTDPRAPTHHAAHARGPFSSPAGVPEPQTYTQLPAPVPCAHAPHTRTQEPTQVGAGDGR